VSRPSTKAIAPCSVCSLQVGNPLTSSIPNALNQLAICGTLMGQNPDRAPTRQTMRGEGGGSRRRVFFGGIATK
jgi:hypothetical protein